MSLTDVYKHKSVVSVWSSYRGWVMTGLFVTQLLLVYGLIQVFISDGMIPRIALDGLIPIKPVFLIPYCLYYLILPLPFIAAYRQEDQNRSLFAVGTAFFVAATICNLIFIIFPTEIVRPDVPGSGFLAEVLRFVHSADGTVALLPSGHVTYSLTAALSLQHIDRQLSYSVWLSALAVIPATVLIGQHYLLDIVAGLVVALLVYLVVFRPLFFREP